MLTRPAQGQSPPRSRRTPLVNDRLDEAAVGTSSRGGLSGRPVAVRSYFDASPQRVDFVKVARASVAKLSCISTVVEMQPSFKFRATSLRSDVMSCSGDWPAGARPHGTRGSRRVPDGRSARCLRQFRMVCMGRLVGRLSANGGRGFQWRQESGLSLSGCSAGSSRSSCSGQLAAKTPCRRSVGTHSALRCRAWADLAWRSRPGCGAVRLDVAGERLACSSR